MLPLASLTFADVTTAFPSFPVSTNCTCFAVSRAAAAASSSRAIAASASVGAARRPARSSLATFDARCCVIPLI
ncbi:hypothetical protein PF005_g13495 [Phytophthora fragariae]|uniref:Uncharacterized protein n=1 Tax=Phytophthora fragariae TaxID=53985 RepID=A0A6A3EVP2_9STRA|nr:hypothetical protein PF009_g13406 [Phytophthora fragariae]KAE9104471.1 hypothetical protein PF007_g14047 [Phytophthora fragariae]KAE9205197.1 hypothetical protein PF005_g13495 [Phytophthora fragariae]KAE9224784.1 hypothetical protein PF004_g12110 [Phytophthora fragariae]KAE9344966.1 hypothetical protein PF008_g8978 [Phytophthora fragariae]